jgi:integrase
MAQVKGKYEQVSPSKLGDWFRNFKRLKQFLTTEDMEIKRFHSFRHNFANALKQGKVMSEMREDLCGHENSGRSAQRDYVEKYDLDLKKQAINQARWECDFTILKA